MARPRTYDRDAVLNRATELFWDKGYEATSMQDLVEATGLNRHSMYREFKNKDGLFAAAIGRYEDRYGGKALLLLAEEDSGLEEVRRFIHLKAAYAAADGCRGCLLVNTVTERAAVSSSALQIVQDRLNAREDALAACLTRAQERGDVGEDRDPKMIAAILISFLQGLMVQGRLGSASSRAVAMADALLDSLI